MAMSTKRELRQWAKALPPLPPHQRGEMSAKLCAHIVDLPAWRRARCVALYAPLPSEPDIDGLWAFREQREMAYPLIQEERISLFAVESLWELVPGGFGIREPRPEKPVSVLSVDLVIVPGVAFTRLGARCGRGKGHYDRLLSELPPAVEKVGICFERQLVEELPLEPHDIIMDVIATENGVYRR
jgi:5-formyltetrahydrofolate cyclo-ligase